jgi:hypothetical protein
MRPQADDATPGLRASLLPVLVGMVVSVAALAASIALYRVSRWAPPGFAVALVATGLWTRRSAQRLIPRALGTGGVAGGYAAALAWLLLIASSDGLIAASFSPLA